MDGRSFDAITRLLAHPISRRRGLAAALGALAGVGFRGASAADGCCTCAGADGCLDVQDNAACTKLCGTEQAVFTADASCNAATKTCEAGTGSEAPPQPTMTPAPGAGGDPLGAAVAFGTGLAGQGYLEVEGYKVYPTMDAAVAASVLNAPFVASLPAQPLGISSLRLAQPGTGDSAGKTIGDALLGFALFPKRGDAKQFQTLDLGQWMALPGAQDVTGALKDAKIKGTAGAQVALQQADGSTLGYLHTAYRSGTGVVFLTFLNYQGAVALDNLLPIVRATHAGYEHGGLAGLTRTQLLDPAGTTSIDLLGLPRWGDKDAVAKARTGLAGDAAAATSSGVDLFGGAFGLSQINRFFGDDIAAADFFAANGADSGPDTLPLASPALQDLATSAGLNADQLRATFSATTFPDGKMLGLRGVSVVGRNVFDFSVFDNVTVQPLDWTIDQLDQPGRDAFTALLRDALSTALDASGSDPLADTFGHPFSPPDPR